MCRILLAVMPFCCSAIVTLPLQAIEPTVTEGRVSAVTVYQGQALVTRDVEVTNAQGLLEIVVTNLPEHVLPGSLFAEPRDGVQIRSVRYRARPIDEDVRQEVRELDDKIQAAHDKLQAVQRERMLLEERKTYLTRLEAFSAKTSQDDLNHGVLNAETLKDLTQFLFAERAEIAARELAVAQEERSHQRELDLVTRRRHMVAAGSARTVREAVVFVHTPQPGQARLRLSYLVGHANWSPSYNLRATAARDRITIEYNASIQQMSGEDWNDVTMVLSTATPSLVAKAPRLEALAIQLGQRTARPDEPVSAAENYRRVQQQRAVIEKSRGAVIVNAADEMLFAGAATETRRTEAEADGGLGSWGFATGDADRADMGLNFAARQLQLLDFNNSLSELRSGNENDMQASEGVSVSYELSNPASVPSRTDRQLIQIAAVPLPAEFYRVATPVLTSFVYEEAALTNSSEYVFLAGPAATFVGGQFVGRGELATVAVGERFSVGLGIDASLRADRELVDKEEQIQGGNRIVDFVYELSLENFNHEPVRVRLFDRLPTVGEDDIQVTLLRSDETLSDDANYQSADRKAGILRWDLDCPPAAVGPNRKTMRYTMRLEYDKQLAIVGMASTR